MKRILLMCLLLLLCLTSLAEDYLQMVSLERNGQQADASFLTEGQASKKGDVVSNASKSVFYTLFYQGVADVNDGKPLVAKDNPIYTNSFFNSTGRYSFYIVSVEEVEKAKKVGDQYRGRYRVTVALSRLLRDMETNKVYLPKGKVAEEEQPVLMPTIIVVPYKRDGESFAAILQNDFDRRVAVSKVQEGFNKRQIVTIDLQARLDAMKRRSAYEENSGDSDSSDKELLKTSGADVYVTVDLQKDVSLTAGARVSLVMKAYGTASGEVLASSNAWTNRFRVTSTDVLCNYAVEDNLPSFMEAIVGSMQHTQSVVLQFSIGGTSVATFNDRVGPNNYALRDVIRQWVRKNAYHNEFHLQGIVDEAIIFDYVKMPSKDQDGLPMDAAQFGFLIESYLKEEMNVDCITRIDGNNIMVTIQ